MEILVKNQNGDTTETVELDDAVFNVPMNHPLVHQVLVIYQLNKRHGTHDTKTRAQVSGGGRKPWIQKHTGRARQGSIRAPQWRHGGVVFGPHPRSYRKDLPRRIRRLALKCVLSDKARQDRLVCLNSMDTVDGKTKSMVSLLENLDIKGSALIVTRESEQSVVRAAHNLKKIWTLPVTLLNAHELLRRDTVIMTLEAARWAEQFLAGEPRRRAAASEPMAEDQTEAENAAADPGPEAVLQAEDGATGEDEPTADMEDSPAAEPVEPEMVSPEDEAPEDEDPAPEGAEN